MKGGEQGKRKGDREIKGGRKGERKQKKRRKEKS